MRKEQRLRYRSIFISILISSIFSIGSLYAADGVSLTVTGGNWAIGTLGPSGTSNTTGNQWTITGSSNGSVDVTIAVTPAAGSAWSAWETDNNSNTTNKFILREDNSSGALIKTSSAITLKSTLPPVGTDNGSYGLDLWFKAPPTGSTASAHTFTVTLTATNWSGTYCAGTASGSRCLYLATVSESCSTFCTDHHGGDGLTDGQAYDTTWSDADPANLCSAMETIDSNTGWPCADWTTNNYAPATLDSQHYYRSSGTYSTSGSLASWVRLCDCVY